ncbi:MAG TPA: methionyl-tRNA formyltransferase [Gemmatimonadaceae bacterium]|jgi:methionyl-tRNA formyltransferase|nr:methionyl-tRNA formyltransferase [Gemmatimonadaceae bacterium]
MKVLFWGTPEFAAPPLRALLGEGFEVVGVVTQPDRPRGRSRSELVASPVKQIAVEESLTILQPERPRGADFLEQIRALEPDISIVVAYGHILPREVIDAPLLGTLNIHASLLPQWRGAAPIQAAIRSGQTETGVTIMRMVTRLDAGPILLQTATPILHDETFGELQLRLSELGALALIEALSLIDLGQITERPQDDAAATYAPKIEREDARIDWTQSASDVACAIRAFDPKPGAFTTLGGTEVKLYGARPWPHAPGASAQNAEPGTVVALDGDGAVVATGNGVIRIIDAQPSGKRRLSVSELARGRGIHVGDRFGA